MNVQFVRCETNSSWAVSVKQIMSISRQRATCSTAYGIVYGTRNFRTEQKFAVHTCIFQIRSGFESKLNVVNIGMSTGYSPLCALGCSSSSSSSTYSDTGNSDLFSCLSLSNLSNVVQNVFKHSTFRPGQLDTMLPVLHRRDVFAWMATGAGKSLCMFAVPLAHSDTAVGVIISPLISLMDEQVRLSHVHFH